MAISQRLKSPVGTSGFSVLREPRAFKEGAKRFYTVQLILNNKDGMEFLGKLDAEAAKLHAIEVEKRKAQGKPARFPVPTVMVTDLPDGSMRFTFKRAEEDNHPGVVNKNNQPHNGMLKQGTPIEVAFEMHTYNSPTALGVKLVLIGVRVLEAEVKIEDLASVFGPPAAGEAKEDVAVTDLF